MTPYSGIFKSRYPVLEGRAWIKQIDHDDLRAFIRMGLEYAEYGRLGGLARSKTALRDKRGRFTKGVKANE